MKHQEFQPNASHKWLSSVTTERESNKIAELRRVQALLKALKEKK